MSVKMLTWEQAVQSLRNQPDQKELVQYCYYDDPLESAAERFAQSEEWIAERLVHDSSWGLSSLGEHLVNLVLPIIS
jgi:hypothetical protein